MPHKPAVVWFLQKDFDWLRERERERKGGEREGEITFLILTLHPYNNSSPSWIKCFRFCSVYFGYSVAIGFAAEVMTVRWTNRRDGGGEKRWVVDYFGTTTIPSYSVYPSFPPPSFTDTDVSPWLCDSHKYHHLPPPLPWWRLHSVRRNKCLLKS